MKNKVTHISNPFFEGINLSKLFDLFANNGYPKYILDMLIYSSKFCDGSVNTFKYYKFPFIYNLTYYII